MKAFLTISAAIVGLSAVAAKIEIAQDRADALYRVGDEAVFTVTVKDDSGALRKEGSAKWSLDNFGSVRFASGKVDLSKGNPFTVKGKMDEEGFLRLSVSSMTNSRVWGVIG